MQELDKILAEIDNLYIDETDFGVECNMENRSDVACDNCYECIKEDCKNIIRKHMNDGWIPVSIRMPEKAGTYIVNVLDGERDIVTFAKWQNRYKRFDMTGVRAYWRIIAWRPLPEPYRPEQPETCKYTGGSCCWPIDQCGECPNNQEMKDEERK